MAKPWPGHDLSAGLYWRGGYFSVCEDVLAMRMEVAVAGSACGARNRRRCRRRGSARLETIAVNGGLCGARHKPPFGVIVYILMPSSREGATLGVSCAR